MRRNSITSGCYEPSRAHLKTLKRRSSIVKKRICDKTKIAVEFMLELDWSPEQISAICKRIGKCGTGVIVNALEQKSSFYLTREIASKHADDVADTLTKMLQPFQSLVHTITAEKGLEFAELKRVAAGLNADVYFTDPYASYQRGANENANGLMRQYVPKGSNLRSLTNQQLNKYQQRLNLRPRKILGFKQPDVVFKEQLQYAQNECCSYQLNLGII